MNIIEYLKLLVLIFLTIVAFIMLRLVIILGWIEEEKAKEKKNDK